MGLIQKTTCKKCGKEFDEWCPRCPHCGAHRVLVNHRAVPPSVSVKPGTAAGKRAAENIKWQKILSAVLVLLVLLSTLALTSVTLNARKTAIAEKAAAEAAAQAAADEQARADAAAAEQARLDEEQQAAAAAAQADAARVSSVAITYFNETKTEFSMNSGSELSLKATVYPMDVSAPVNWSSSDETILTITEDANGVNAVTVKGVKSGWATITVTCGAATAECKVLVQ